MPSAYLRHICDGQLRWVENFAPRDWKSRSNYWRIKRLFDLIFVIVSVPGWLPICFIIALLIKLESPRDPIFYVQRRTGEHGLQFRMFKFRTMNVGADSMVAALQHLNIGRNGENKLVNDPRVTSVGKWLRAAKVDELPQFVNILLGHMTLVGPRPTSYGRDTFTSWQSERFDVKPGVTGLWQLYQDRVIDLHDKVRLDIAYQQRQCIGLDAWILFKTFRRLALPSAEVRRAVPS